MKIIPLIIILLFVANSLACHSTPPTASSSGPTTILIVRHAEKASDGDDPPLTEAGMRRALALVQVAEDAGVKAVYTTQLKRNRDTAQPLAERLGITPTEVAVN